MAKDTTISPCFIERVCRPLLLLIAGLLLLTGCGRRANLGAVEGTVTLDGKPLSSAMVSFHPVKGGRQSFCRTDAKGHCQLRYIAGEKGALAGRHKVTVNTACAEGAAAKFDKEKVPAKYNAKSTLEDEVLNGPNTIDLPLTSR
jgi:hypothetical protein